MRVICMRVWCVRGRRRGTGVGVKLLNTLKDHAASTLARIGGIAHDLKLLRAVWHVFRAPNCSVHIAVCVRHAGECSSTAAGGVRLLLWVRDACFSTVLLRLRVCSGRRDATREHFFSR